MLLNIRYLKYILRIHSLYKFNSYANVNIMNDEYRIMNFIFCQLSLKQITAQ